MIGGARKTERGFERIDFVDFYDVPCSLQQSSLATEDAVWLGQGSYRMHLNREQVVELIAVLQRWVDTGSFVAE